MNEEPFCLVGLLKVGKSLERVTNLLPPNRRKIVLRLAAEFSDLPPHELRKKLAALRDKYSWWPGSDSAYIIWFTPNEYTYYAPPEDLSAIVDIKLLYQDEIGQLFYVTKKK